MTKFVESEREKQFSDSLETVSDSTIPELENDQRRSLESGLTISKSASNYALLAHDDIGLDDKFYPDHVVAVFGDGSDRRPDEVPDEPMVATVQRSDTDQILVEPSASRYTDDQLQAYKKWFDGTAVAAVVELYHPTTTRRELRAIERLVDKSYRGLRLSTRIDFLNGRREPGFTEKLRWESSQHDKELYQNDQQEQAIHLALAADPFACIHGPPGTGKTRVLVEIVRRLTEAGQSVLVAGDSNPATDKPLFGSSTVEIVDQHSLASYAEGSPNSRDDIALLRGNARTSDHPLLNMEGWFDPSCGVHNAEVVVTTTNSAARLASKRDFDYAIIDEAGQASFPSSAIPYSIADKLVLIGDPQQLPPFRHTDPADDPEEFPKSMLENLYGPDSIFGIKLGVQLNTQYRMHSDIAALSDTLTYDDEISTAVERDPVFDDGPLRMFDVTSHRGPNENQDGTSWENEAEALCCVIEARALLNKGLEQSEIGITTPYRAQVNTIRDALDAADIPESKEITVDTITAFQGDERPAMICSLVRSNRSENVGFLEEYDGPNRLTVALTRAKRHLTLIGDWNTLTTHSLYQQLHDLLVDETEPISREGSLIVDEY